MCYVTHGLANGRARSVSLKRIFDFIFAVFNSYSFIYYFVFLGLAQQIIIDLNFTHGIKSEQVGHRLILASTSINERKGGIQHISSDWKPIAKKA